MPPPWNGLETDVATVKPVERGLAVAVDIGASPGLHGDALRAQLVPNRCTAGRGS